MHAALTRSVARLVTEHRKLAALRSCSSSASIDLAADATIAALRQHPALLQKVLQKGDASVKQAVLKSTASAAFAEADTDGDGHVSNEERVAYLNLRRRGPTATKHHATGALAGVRPDNSKLRQLAVFTCVPFIGFGFLDNFIMITAGDQIDATFGATLGLSSMAAAGLGNLISDVVGIQAGDVIQRVASSAGLPEPDLTEAERKSRASALVTVVASMVGISIGCVLGLVPLLMMEDEESRAITKAFNNIDRDGNGRISIGELDDALHNMGISFSRGALEQVFMEIDSDRDRRIDLDEFKSLCAKWKQLSGKG